MVDMPLQIKNVQFGLPGIFAPHESVTVKTATYTGEISQLSRFEVHLNVLGSIEQCDLHLQDWPGSQAVIQFSAVDDSDTFTWVGVIESVNAKAGANTGGIGDLFLRLAGWPSTLAGEYFSKRYQFYQDKSSTEMAKTIFESSGGKFISHLKDSKAKQAYQVQYGESDEHFIQRVLGEDQLLFSVNTNIDLDSFPTQIVPLQCDVYEELRGFPKTPKTGLLSISSAPAPLGLSTQKTVYNMIFEMQRPFTEVAMVADKPFKDFRSSAKAIPSKNQIHIPGCSAETTPLSSNRMIEELIDKKFSSVTEGAAQAKTIMDASAAVHMRFNCDLPYLNVGKYFELVQEIEGVDQKTAVALVKTSQRIEFNSETGLWNFQGEFTGLTQDARYQLSPLPSRNLPGLLRGIVLGQNNSPSYGSLDDDTKVYADKWGRLKVRILWHNAIRSSNQSDNQESTLWLRMVTPWAGHQSGFLAIPKVGQEVMISFVNNDPNKPIVLGCLYGDGESSSELPPWDPTQDAWVGIGSRTNNPDAPQHIKLDAAKDSKLGIDISSATDLKLKALKSNIMNAANTSINSKDGTIELNAKELIINGAQESSNKLNKPGGSNESHWDQNVAHVNKNLSFIKVNENFYGHAGTFSGMSNFFYGGVSTVASIQATIVGTQGTVANFQTNNCKLKHDFIKASVSVTDTALSTINVNIEDLKTKLETANTEIKAGISKIEYFERVILG